nr:retrovirus-related Pol polyprotein from transposon TNT 1-94 [Tanacetum cinerariifolium]
MEILIQTCLMPLATKTQNDSFRFVHELKQEMHADLKYVESLEKEIDELESDKDALDELQCLYLHKKNIRFLLELLCKNVKNSELKKLIEKGKGKSVDTKFDKPSVVRQLNAQQIPKPSVLGKPTPFSNSLKRIYFSKTKSVPKANVSEGLSKLVTAQTLPQTARQAVSNTNVLKPGMYRINNRIPSVSNKMKSVTACKDSLNSRTLNANAVCATCNKCLVDSNHFACVAKMLNDVNARTKKPNVVPISTRKPKSHANKSIATSHKKKIVQLILFIVDSGYMKHMTGNLNLLSNFIETFLGTVRFGNDQFAPILGYGDLVQGNVMINRVYYVEGLNQNLFSVGQFCDADLEVAFKKSTCFVRDLQGNDLLTRNHGSDLYTISLQESTSSTPLCLMAKASPTQAWLWYRRLSYLNFHYINLLSKKDIVIGLPKLKYVKDQLCSSCELSKAKRSSFKLKDVPSSKGRLNLLHMDLCGLMRVASINGKKYILVIVVDYSRYTWTLFLRSKEETPEVLKEFLTMIQRNLQALVITVRTDRGTEFLNKTLNAFFKEEGIKHQTSTARTPEQNGMKEKGDLCILVGYSTQSKGYRVYNKKTRMIVESIHIRFDEIKEVSVTCTCSITTRVGSFIWSFVRFNAGSNPQDKQPITNIPSTSAPSTPTYVHTEENNNDQAEDEQLLDDEFTNPFCAPAQKEAESSSHNIGNSNVLTFNQPHVFEYRWTKDHPLEQVRGNPSRPEAMADSAWIEVMQEELHQFDRLQVWELVDKPFNKTVIRLKWLWKNKKDEDQTIIRNKARLVAKGYAHEEGLHIHRSPRGIFINQAKYTLEILHKHGMDKCQSIGTPMATKPKLDADLSGNTVDQTDYRSKIGSLMYLTSRRRDIVQAVCFCARYQSRPTEKHLKEVKRIFRYLRGTVNMGLWYPKGSRFGLTAFSDADHAGCIDSRKSTSGGIPFLSDKLVSRMLKKQNFTAMSSAEAEYVALSASYAQVMWMRTQLQDYGFNYNKIPLYCDSQTEYQLADIFTKALPKDRFKYLVRRIDMKCLTLAELEVLANESA